MAHNHLAGAGFLAHRGLMLVAAGGSMAEAAVVAVVAPGARALTPQITALAPLAIFHDLRWLYADRVPWPAFCATLLAVLAARATVTATLAWLAWPAGMRRPGFGALLRGGALATLLTAALLSPLVTLDFGVALLPFSWPLLGILPILVVLAGLLGHAGAVPWWWRAVPPLRVVTWSAADFLVLSAAAATIGWLPASLAVPAAAVAGLCNARAWYGVTRAMASRARLTAPVTVEGSPRLAAPEPARSPGVPRPASGPARSRARRLPVAPLAALAAAAMVIGLTRLIFAVVAAGTVSGATAAHTGAAPARPEAAHPGRAPRGGTRLGVTLAVSRTAVLDIEGFGSSCCTSPRALGVLAPGGLVEQFSYRGLGPAGQPLPHGRAASDMQLAALGDRIAAQVWRLHRATGRPVDIVAESEGTLGVYAMLARHPRVPLRSIVLLSPILSPGQVGYSVGGAGLLPGDELRAVVSFVGSLSPYGASAAQRLISSVNRSGARFAAAAVAAARGHRFRWLLVIPLADALTMPSCALPADAVVVPALHGGLSGDPAVQSIVRGFLADHPVRARPGMRELAETFAAAGAAWRMPAPGARSPRCPAL
jgi:hypothetical protein